MRFNPLPIILGVFLLSIKHSVVYTDVITADLLIENGRIYDGTGNSWYYGDLVIADDRITHIILPNEDLAVDAELVIDAEGLAVAPGFVDVHTHADSTLYEKPLAENFIRNGVTTIITGNCGYSVKDIKEYSEKLAESPTALNVATLIGHNTVLRNVKGNVAGELNEEQLQQARDMVKKAMEDGAVGMSTGLIYTPGTYSPIEEIIEMQRVAAEYGGIYATHMRSESLEIKDAIAEALRIGRESGSRVQISHFKLPRDMEQRLGSPQATLDLVYQAREEGMEVWIDQYPYTASSTGISVLFPDWLLEAGSDEAKTTLSDPEKVVKVKADMAEHHETNRLRKDFDFAKIASSDAYPDLAGKSIKEVATMKKEEVGSTDKDVTMDEQYDTIIDIYMKGGASMVYHTMNETAVETIMKSPLVSVCSDSGVRKFGEGNPHPRGYGANARVLGEYVRERKVLTLEEAIRKMTSMPATAFRLKDRGLIREGFAADLVVFDPDTITDNATFEEPHQYSTGFRAVIVNGEVIVENDEITGARPGKFVFGPGFK